MLFFVSGCPNHLYLEIVQEINLIAKLIAKELYSREENPSVYFIENHEQWEQDNRLHIYIQTPVKVDSQTLFDSFQNFFNQKMPQFCLQGVSVSSF